MRPTERLTLHFDLNRFPDVPYIFHCAGRKAPLVRHTPATLKAARASSPILRVFPDDALSHYVEAVLPSDALALMSVSAGKKSAPVHLGIHIPAASREKAEARIPVKPGAIHPKLAFHGITAEQIKAATGDDSLPQFPSQIHTVQDAIDAAIALLFCHHDLINLAQDTGAYIVSSAIIQALGTTGNDLPNTIYNSFRKSWLVQVKASDGSVYYHPNPQLLPHMTAAIQDAVKTVKNDQSLEGQQWQLIQGVTSSSYNASTAAADLAMDDDSGNTWTVQNLTPGNGLTVDFGGYTGPSGGDVWQANGLWSSNDAAPLTSDVASALLAGNVTVAVTAPDGTSLASASLVPGTVTPGQATSFSTTFSGSAASSISGASFSLNTGQSGFTYTLTVSGVSNPVVQLMSAGASIYQIPVSDTGNMGTLSVTLTNSWLRHLSAYVQFLDAGGNAITPSDTYPDSMPSFLRSTFEPDATKKFLALISPVSTAFGVPLPAIGTSLTISVPDGTTTVRLLAGGLGRGTFDPAVCPVGLAMTAFAELALPVLLLAGGSAETSNSSVSSLISDPEVMFAICAAGAFLVAGGAATYIALSDDPGVAAEKLAETFGPMLLKKGVSSLAKWFAMQEGEAAAEDAIPFIDIGLEVLRVATTTAELAETTIEVLDSPYVYETDIVQSMNLSVTLYPDPSKGQFPDYHDLLRVVVAYDCGTTLPVWEQSYANVTSLPPSISVSFQNVPAGGNLQVYAFFYSSNGWQSGQGQSPWVAATSTNGTLEVCFNITDNVVPLTINTVYQHQGKIGMVDGGLGWITTSTAPTETMTTPSPFAPEQSVTKLVDVTVSQLPQMMGYAWEATGLNGSSSDAFTVQTLSIGSTPTSGLATPAVNFSAQSGITFDAASPDDGTGRNFYIDPTPGTYVSDPDDPSGNNLGGGYHLRQAALTDGTAPSLPTGDQALSCGRFLIPVDRYAVHPQGYVFGITAQPSKIHRIQLPVDSSGNLQPVSDASAPMATLLSGEGSREGLVGGPAGIAIALDGRVIVAEGNNYRLQAFDVNGNPVPYFNGGTSSTAPLQNQQGDVILDLAIEGKGYIYVLYSTGDGSSADQYWLAIYQPDGTYLTQTQNFAAGCISVDLLRAVFALNYEMIVDQNNRIQPTVSKWLPTPPSSNQ